MPEYPTTTWIYSVAVCGGAVEHDRCSRWHIVSEHVDGRDDALRSAVTHAHARVTRHAQGYPQAACLAFEHQEGGGPCAVCVNGRGPCAETPGGPLFLCADCTTVLDQALGRDMAQLGLASPLTDSAVVFA
ncbi:hypothetical protein ACFWFU_09230 [Streptomyces sp. NPDC060235]|uniref:hypothetical protein n=1 Tax=unclassified Streptomyces TaxID=2593676 RepID=UPI003657E95B